MKKRLQMIKLFGRPLNRFYPMKLCRERERERERVTLIEEDEIVESDITQHKF